MVWLLTEFWFFVQVFTSSYISIIPVVLIIIILFFVAIFFLFEIIYNWKTYCYKL